MKLRRRGWKETHTDTDTQTQTYTHTEAHAQTLRATLNTQWISAQTTGAEHSSENPVWRSWPKSGGDT